MTAEENNMRINHIPLKECGDEQLQLILRHQSQYIYELEHLIQTQKVLLDNYQQLVLNRHLHPW